MSLFLLFYVDESIPGDEIAGTTLRVLRENSQRFCDVTSGFPSN